MSMLINILAKTTTTAAALGGATGGVCSDENVLKVMGIVKLIMNVICIIVPIVLIILGSFDLFKAVTAGKDEDIKKKQQTLIKRIIAGVIIFLVPTIVIILMNLIGVGGWQDCWDNADPDFSTLFTF